MPRPKWCCQRRLTMTREVIGLSFDAIQLARTVRRPDDLPIGFASAGSGKPNTDGKPGTTLSPGTCGLPRLKTKVSGAFGPPSTTHSAISTDGIAGALRKKSICLVKANHSRLRLPPGARAPSGINCPEMSANSGLSVGPDRLRPPEIRPRPGDVQA